MRRLLVVQIVHGNYLRTWLNIILIADVKHKANFLKDRVPHSVVHLENMIGPTLDVLDKMLYCHQG